MNDFASSLWNLGNYSGEAVGPLIGGVITTKYSFVMSCYAVSLINFVFALIYSIYIRAFIKNDIFNDNDSTKKVTSLITCKSARELKVIFKEELIKSTSSNQKDSFNSYDYSRLK